MEKNADVLSGKNTRLIMFEGLPGTGKSTNSYLSYTQLERGGKTVKWIHEVACPHPLFVFGEAILSYDEYSSFLKAYPQAEPVLNRLAEFRKRTVGIDLLELEWNHLTDIGESALLALREYDGWNFTLDKYIDVALEKWACFAENAVKDDSAVYILDSAMFQCQLFSFLLKNAPYDELERFIQKLLDIVKPLNPSLIYFYRENAEDTISFLESHRGTRFMKSIWERDKAQPYYADKPRGAEGHKQFLRDYADIAQRLFDVVSCRKMSIEITKQDWKAYEDKILSFIGTEYRPHPGALPPNGVFRNETLGMEIEVKGLSIKDPEGKKRTLTPKSECAFYVECLPAILLFNGPDQITISGGQICARWTALGTQFIRDKRVKEETRD